MSLFNDHDKKKNFMVEWKDTKGKTHNTKVLKRCISASEALRYIQHTRSTCCGGRAWWIGTDD
jgi:hypothetical protein